MKMPISLDMQVQRDSDSAWNNLSAATNHRDFDEDAMQMD